MMSKIANVHNCLIAGLFLNAYIISVSATEVLQRLCNELGVKNGEKMSIRQMCNWLLLNTKKLFW